MLKNQMGSASHLLHFILHTIGMYIHIVSYTQCTKPTNLPILLHLQLKYVDDDFTTQQ